MSFIVVPCRDVTKIRKFLESIFFSSVITSVLPQFQFDHSLVCHEEDSYLLVSEKAPKELLGLLPPAHYQITLQVTGLDSLLMAVALHRGKVDDDYTSGKTQREALMSN